jgi:O-antigen ligase
LHAPNANPLTRAAEVVATYGVAAIVLTLPLEFTAKYLHQQLSRFVLAVVLLAFVYLVATRRRSVYLPLRPSVIALALLVVVSIASWAVTRAPGSTNTLLDIALYPFFAILVVNLAVTREDHRRAWIAFLVSALIVSALGVILYLTHSQIWSPNPAVAHRLNITFADPNITARFLTLGACAAVLVFAARRAPSWLTVSAAVACGVVLPLTWSRSGLALFLLMVLLMVGFAFDRRRALAIAAVALVAFALSTGLNPDTRQRAGDAFATFTALLPTTSQGTAAAPGSPQGLADNRVFLVKAGLKMFEDHPISGVGYGAYQHSLLTTYRSFLPHGYTDSVSHTAVVTVMAEQGIIGAALLAAFLLLLAREAWLARSRADDWAVWATIAAAMVVPIFMYSQFEARFLQEPYLWLALGMFYAAERSAVRVTAAQPEKARTEYRRFEVA